jgi:hypothetical protein
VTLLAHIAIISHVCAVPLPKQIARSSAARGALHADKLEIIAIRISNPSIREDFMIATALVAEDPPIF